MMNGACFERGATSETVVVDGVEASSAASRFRLRVVVVLAESEPKRRPTTVASFLATPCGPPSQTQKANVALASLSARRPIETTISAPSIVSLAVGMAAPVVPKPDRRRAARKDDRVDTR